MVEVAADAAAATTRTYGGETQRVTLAPRARDGAAAAEVELEVELELGAEVEVALALAVDAAGRPRRSAARRFEISLRRAPRAAG